MRLLFVHQNFPGQYVHIARHFASGRQNQVVTISKVDNRKINFPNMRHVFYKSPPDTPSRAHRYLRALENQVRRGQLVYKAAMQLRKQGFVPQVICAHPGWGEALYLRDAFPSSKILLFCEFYYRSQGSDVGFDPEFPAKPDDGPRVRTMDAAQLLSLNAGDWGVSPTFWQRRQFPRQYQDNISVIFDGVDTKLVAPDPKASLTVAGGGPTLTAKDEVITYVARNLEPYRGIHTFIRALPRILELRPKAQVLLVGGTDVSYGRRLPKGQTYKAKYLKETGLKSDRVHFLGRLPYNEYLKVLQISSLHVYLTYPFVLSWSMLEAMSAGCLVLASATAPVMEVIREGRNGLLCDFFDSQGLAKRVDEALNKGKALNELRKNARRTILARYDLHSKCLPGQVGLINLLASDLRPPQPE
ncbi:MAG: glycosyltransferase family 4 protein [Desulfarculaceae bacterium]|jgi:glycosyltransferase involved in cell wall biosynthesis